MTLLTVKELAEMLQLNPQTVYRKTRKGIIPATIIGPSIRFDKDVINEWLAGQTKKVKTAEEKSLPNDDVIPIENAETADTQVSSDHTLNQNT